MVREGTCGAQRRGSNSPLIYLNSMLKELQDLGLSEKEARVYLAALEIGATTADKLAKHAKIKRPTTYVQIESLMKMGLMSTYVEGKKTMFAPESPELLRRVLSRRRDDLAGKERDLASYLPELMRQFASAGERPVVRFFPGKEGLIAVREEILTVKEKSLAVIFSSVNMNKVFEERELEDYTKRRIALEIKSRAIYTNKDFFDKAPQDALSEWRYLPELPISIDVRIFDDKVAIFSLEGAIFAMVIQSQKMSESMKLIFDLLWRGAQY